MPFPFDTVFFISRFSGILETWKHCGAWESGSDQRNRLIGAGIGFQPLCKKARGHCRKVMGRLFHRDLILPLDHCASTIDTQIESEVRMETSTRQEQAKKTVHITWNEAQRAETARETMRRARYKTIPAPSLLKLFAASVSRELPKLKAAALRFVSVKNH
jgi:hypothetical protein